MHRCSNARPYPPTTPAPPTEPPLAHPGPRVDGPKSDHIGRFSAHQRGEMRRDEDGARPRGRYAGRTGGPLGAGAGGTRTGGSARRDAAGRRIGGRDAAGRTRRVGWADAAGRQGTRPFRRRPWQAVAASEMAGSWGDGGGFGRAAGFVRKAWRTSHFFRTDAGRDLSTPALSPNAELTTPWCGQLSIRSCDVVELWRLSGDRAVPLTLLGSSRRLRAVPRRSSRPGRFRRRPQPARVASESARDGAPIPPAGTLGVPIGPAGTLGDPRATQAAGFDPRPRPSAAVEA